MSKKSQGKVSVSLAASAAYLKLMADNGWVTKRTLSLWLKNSRNRNQVLKDLETEGYIRSLRINDRVQAKRRQYRMAEKQRRLNTLHHFPQQYMESDTHCRLTAGIF